MLTELCQYLKNWFNRKPNGDYYPKYNGKVVISEGNIIFADSFALVDGQYYRIMGSLFNDGVHKVGDTLIDEVFEGAVWSMAVPPVVVSLAAEIADWQAKYGSVDSEAMSPFQSESFGGYSYSKSGGGYSASGANKNAATWENVFAARLEPWRKI